MDDMGIKIHNLRLEKGMTLEELGKIVGVGKSTVRKWETGDIANMRRDKIAKVAAALNTSPEYLMGWSKMVPIEYDGNDYVIEKYNPEIDFIESNIRTLTPENLNRLKAYLVKLCDIQNDEEELK